MKFLQAAQIWVTTFFLFLAMCAMFGGMAFVVSSLYWIQERDNG